MCRVMLCCAALCLRMPDCVSCARLCCVTQKGSRTAYKYSSSKAKKLFSFLFLNNALNAQALIKNVSINSLAVEGSVSDLPQRSTFSKFYAFKRPRREHVKTVHAVCKKKKKKKCLSSFAKMAYGQNKQA